jgi:CheY-like chemotaxis protein
MTQQNDSRTTKIDEVFNDLDLVRASAQRETEAGYEDEAIIPWVIELRVIGTPHIIRVPVKDMLVIGRKDAARGLIPDIDLGPYEAQQRGVSRKHARMIMRDNRLTLEDLGSANGTYVNGQMLDILRPQRIRAGDHIKLGTLSMQVHLLVKPSSDDDTLPGIGNELKIEKVGQGQHLLVVDDNEEVCQVVRFIGNQSGFRVSVAHSLVDAYTVIDRDGIDMLMVEILLTEGDGLDVVEYVRNKVDHAVPIIAVASSAGGFTMGQAVSTGVDLYLVKPLAVDELIKTLAKAAGILNNPSTETTPEQS